ncbi:MAG: methylthioribulose 1-phosphate dehydratase [archaeon]|nr:methylthioribulose 1-phosphate dehydratase [archaeon]
MIPELGKQFYKLGWVSGTGGGISIRRGKDVYIAPSGVQKERIKSAEIYIFDLESEQINEQASPAEAFAKKPSECTPLFFAAYRLRSAGAVIHSHSLSAVFATLITPFAEASEWVCGKMEMVKGIKGHTYHDNLVVPIIPNTPRECELTESLTEAIQKYPRSYAVLVRGHGVYVWGDTWQQAKGHAECYDYLFGATIKAHKLGVSLKW